MPQSNLVRCLQDRFCYQKDVEVEFAVEGKNNKGSAITAEVSVEVAPR